MRARAATPEQARSDPDTVFGPLDLRAGLRVPDVGCGLQVGPSVSI